MTEEQTFNIPLDSPLDINMNDMLVPVESPTFTFNRQKLLGGVLQTSVRYEADGWFAGWWQHTFELVSTGTNWIANIFPSTSGITNTSDPVFIEDMALRAIVYNRQTDKGVSYFVFRLKGTDLKVSINPERWDDWFTGSGNWSRHVLVGDAGFDIIRISNGRTEMGDTFSIDIDTYTGEIVSGTFVRSNPDLQARTQIKNKAIHLFVDPRPKVGEDWFIYRTNSPVVINNNTLSYECTIGDYLYNSDGSLHMILTEHIWGKTLNNLNGEFKLTVAQGVNWPDDIVHSVHTPDFKDVDNNSGEPEFEIVNASDFTELHFNEPNYPIKNRGTINEVHQLKIRNNTIIDMVLQPDFIEKWTAVRFDTYEPVVEFVNNARVDDPCNRQITQISSVLSNDSNEAETIIVHGLPVWLLFETRWFHDSRTSSKRCFGGPWPSTHDPISPPIGFSTVADYLLFYAQARSRFNLYVNSLESVNNPPIILQYRIGFVYAPELARFTVTNDGAQIPLDDLSPDEFDQELRDYLRLDGQPLYTAWRDYTVRTELNLDGLKTEASWLDDGEETNAEYDYYHLILELRYINSNPLITGSSYLIPSGETFFTIRLMYWGNSSNLIYLNEYEHGASFIPAPARPTFQILNKLNLASVPPGGASIRTILAVGPVLQGPEATARRPWSQQTSLIRDMIFPTNNPNTTTNTLSAIGGIHIRVPICIYGYAKSKLQTIDILASNKSAWTITPIADHSLRIDNNNNNNIIVRPEFVLNLCKHELHSIVNGIDLAIQELQILLTSTDINKPLYIVTTAYNNIAQSINLETGNMRDIERIISGVFPEWIIQLILQNNIQSTNYITIMRMSNDNTQIYYPGLSSSTIGQLQAQVTISNFIDKLNITFNHLSSIYNSGIANELRQHFIADEETGENNNVEIHDPIYGDPWQITQDYTFQGYGQNITLHFYHHTFDMPIIGITLIYQADRKVIHFSGNFLNSEDPRVSYKYKGFIPINPDARVPRAIIQLQNLEPMELDFRRAFIPEVNGFVKDHVPLLYIESQKGNIVKLSDGYGEIDISIHDLYDSKVIQFISMEELQNWVYKYYIAENNTADVRLIPQGIFERNSTTIRFTSQVTYDTYYRTRFSFWPLSGPNDHETREIRIDKDTELNLLYATKDIRLNEKPQFVFRNNLTDMRQFIKQFWSNDTATENYWWIDHQHILELTRKEFIVWKKSDNGTDELPVDDWNGNKWEKAVHLDEAKIPRRDPVTKALIPIEQPVPMQCWRHNLLSVNDLYYGVSNAKNSRPVFFKLQATIRYDGNHNIGQLCILYLKDDIIDAPFDNIDMNNDGTADNLPEWHRVYIDVYKTDLGEKLPEFSSTYPAISAYTELNPAAIIGSSKISATVVGSYFILGIAYTRGLAQWTIVMERNHDIVRHIITGYGHVGVDGCLTGGQLPSVSGLVCANNIGFNTIVYNITELEDMEERLFENQANELPSSPLNHCYGTGSTVWFVYDRIDRIVSHFIFDPVRCEHICSTNNQQLSLTSNAVRRYVSSSFEASGLFDLFVPPLGFGLFFSSIFEMSPAIRIISDILLPVLFVIDLKYVMLAYINHSFGQYCYVYRNSTKDHLPDGKTDQDIKFQQDKYQITFENDADNTSFWVEIILKSIEFADAVAAERVVNRAQNQTSTDDSKGRKFGQFFIENLTDTVASNILSTGFNISLKSAISQAWTLDMFYSISDRTQCFAGPGFVNHNFIGQCVAQSVTDTQLLGRRVGYWCTLRTLSRAVVAFKIAVLEYIKAALVRSSERIAHLGIPVPMSGTLNIGAAIGVAMNIIAGLMDALITTNRIGIDIIEGLADAIGPPTGKAYAAGTLTKYDTNIEGTHTYGNKPMSFFWPAFGISRPIKYNNEFIDAQVDEDSTQDISFSGRIHVANLKVQNGWTDGFDNDAFLHYTLKKLPFKGKIKSVEVKAQSVSSERANAIAPENMAVIEGAKGFLPINQTFRNEQIGVGPPVFPPPPIHDYEIDREWKLGFTAGAGEIIWVCCDDTKVIDGPPSNIVINPWQHGSRDVISFCGIASSYTAIEILDLFDERYLRPWAVTPSAIGLNINKINCVQDGKAYHAFDGQGNRITYWPGGSGMDKAVLVQQYQFQVNDHFKRSNILPPSQFFGIFEGPPSHAMRSIAPGEPVANLVQALGQQTGLEHDIPGEQRDLQRFSIPVHCDQLSTLPAMVRMLAPYKLHVVEGITSLTTDIRTTQTRYKAPSSIDFNIYKDVYRSTDEYLCEVTTEGGIVAVRDICATAGLQFVGATTKEAFYFSPATRMYYGFANGREIQKIDVMNRFSDIYTGRWDFVNQEVMFKVRDNNRDENMVVRLDYKVLGEVFPPNKTIYSDKSDYKLLSMAGGTVFQGPRRFIVNRFVILDYMIEDIKYNNRRHHDDSWPLERGKKRWSRVTRNKYSQERDYGWHYVDFDKIEYVAPDGTWKEDDWSPWYAVQGWTHNPKGLVTSMLGIDDMTDCKFEWALTFAWTAQMGLFYEQNEYATVCVMAETVTQGGTVKSEPTNIYLFKECFTRSGNAGYYTFKYQSNNGVGNRERLYIWGDAITAIQDLKLRCKEFTTHRTQPLHTQVDVKDLIEI